MRGKKLLSLLLAVTLACSMPLTACAANDATIEATSASLILAEALGYCELAVVAQPRRGCRRYFPLLAALGSAGATESSIFDKFPAASLTNAYCAWHNRSISKPS